MTRVGRGRGPRTAAPGCRTMPSEFLVTVEQRKKKKKKNTEAPIVSKWCQRQILNAYLFIYVCVFIYLCRLTQGPSSTVAAALFEVLLPVITLAKQRQKNTDLTPPESDFTPQLFRNCSNTKALWIFLLILLDVSEENWCFFPLPHFFFFLSFRS